MLQEGGKAKSFPLFFIDINFLYARLLFDIFNNKKYSKKKGGENKVKNLI